MSKTFLFTKLFFMKPMFGIYQSDASRIVSTMFMMFAELSGSCFGCLGMLHSGNVSISTLVSEVSGANLLKEVENYLATAEKRRRAGSPILTNGTPHSISGVRMEDGSTYCFGSPFGDPYDLAVAVIYAHYHQLKEKMVNVDDVFVDTLLLHLGRWQEKNAHDNDIIMQLAKAEFKSEAVNV